MLVRDVRLPGQPAQLADVHSRLDDGFGRWDGRSSVVQEGSDLLPELLLVSLELGELLIQVLNNISQTADFPHSLSPGGLCRVKAACLITWCSDI